MATFLPLSDYVEAPSFAPLGALKITAILAKTDVGCDIIQLPRERGNKMKATVHKVNPVTKKRISKLFEDTLGASGNMGYKEWKDVREAYKKHYGAEIIEFVIN